MWSKPSNTGSGPELAVCSMVTVYQQADRATHRRSHMIQSGVVIGHGGGHCDTEFNLVLTIYRLVKIISSSASCLFLSEYFRKYPIWRLNNICPCYDVYKDRCVALKDRPMHIHHWTWNNVFIGWFVGPSNSRFYIWRGKYTTAMNYAIVHLCVLWGRNKNISWAF